MYWLEESWVIAFLTSNWYFREWGGVRGGVAHSVRLTRMMGSLHTDVLRGRAVR